jgi:hypothetical protein
MRHVASRYGRSTTNGANYTRGKIHHRPWHSDIRTPNQLNIKNELQQSVNNFWSYMLDNNWAVQQHLAIIIILAALTGKNATDENTTTS